MMNFKCLVVLMDREFRVLETLLFDLFVQCFETGSLGLRIRGVEFS